MRVKVFSETISALGHENIRATHRATLEFTKDKHVSSTGDCIVAVNADKACVELNGMFKDKLRILNAKLLIGIEVDGITEYVSAFGSPKLTLNHPSDIVIRKSSYIDSRTLAICADKAAKDLSRQLVKKMQSPVQKARITLTVTT